MTLSNPFTHDARVYNEARSLVKAGHKVTVLGWDKKRENPPLEIKDGIDIFRSYNTKFMDHLPYDIFRMHFWWKKGYRDALELHEKKHFDVVHCHDLDSLPIGVKLKKKLGLPLIYDAHEIWGYMVAEGLLKAWAGYYLLKEKNLIKYVDRIITVSDILKEYFNKISQKKLTIIMNCKSLKGTKYEPLNNNCFTLLYLGNLRKTRFLLELVDVVKQIPNVNCKIGGSGRDVAYINTLMDKISKTENVDFIGRIPLENVLPITKESDVVICMFNPKYYVRIGLPNKVFESMICGRPILVTKNTYSGKFVEKEKCGLIIPYTKEDLKKAIIELRDNQKLREELGKNALNAAIRKYNWPNQEEKLIKLYEDFNK